MATTAKRRTATAHHKQRKATADEKIVKRLLKDAAFVKSRAEKSGFVYGADWATRYAEIVELEAIEGYVAAGGLFVLLKCRDPQSEFEAIVSPFSHFREYGFWDHFTAAPLLEFDEHGHGINPDAEAPGFVRGFAEGALSVWLKVKDQVRTAIAQATENLAPALRVG